MTEESEDQTQRVFELLHSLVRETEALQTALERELLFEESSDGKSISPHGKDYLKSRSLYRDFEWRINRKELTLQKVTRALGLILREIGFFRVMLQNLNGSVTRQQPLTPSKRPIRLERLIEEVVDLFEYSADAKGVDIRTHIIGNPVANIDRDLIHRVLVNLVDNAVKYSYSSADTSNQRYINIECRRHSVHGDWMISVSSYGVRIDQGEISSGYLFEYGTRGRFSNDRRRSGTGIGLAEAKRIVEAHHGKIQVESNKTLGDTFLTTVKVILPAT
jgi:two-component system sensor histidine kinase CiaH